MTRSIAWVAVYNYLELDGLLVPSGRRFLDLSASEILSFTWSWLVAGRDAESRRKLVEMMTGDRDPEGRPIVDDDDAPDALRGRAVPDWWGDVDDPHFAQLPSGTGFG